MIRTLTTGVTVTLALALASAATAQPMRPGAPPMADGGALPTPAYVATAARSDEFEIAEARMALHHTSNPHVRAFAQMMVRDHSKSTMMIKAAIRHSGHPVPPPPPLGPEQRQMIAALRGSGPAFDRVYMDQQVQAHEKALGVHQGYANGGDDPALQHAAQKIVPVVQHHLEMAHDIRSHIG